MILIVLLVVGVGAALVLSGGGGSSSASALQTYAANAGFSGGDLAIAVAVAMAESGGDPAAVGDLNVTPGGSIGLWQINLAAHPEYTAAQLTDPQTNANAAYAIYSAAGGFSPWTTYNTGAYLAFMPTQDSVTATDQVAVNTAPTVSGGTDDTAGDDTTADDTSDTVYEDA